MKRVVLVGTLLGDANIQKGKNSINCRMRFEQSIMKSSYINHLYEIFKEWVGVSPVIRKIYKTDYKNFQSILFQTYSHEEFTYYYKLFYINRIKAVPKNISDILTARSLAYWFMDGMRDRNSAYRLCTNGFTRRDTSLG